MVAKGDEVVHDPEAGPVVTVEEVQRWDRLSLGRFVGLVLVTLIQDGLYVAVEPGLEPQTHSVELPGLVVVDKSAWQDIFLIILKEPPNYFCHLS